MPRAAVRFVEGRDTRRPGTGGEARFVDDPLASGSERFPLAWAGLAEPGDGGSPSTAGIRPLGLHALRVMGSPGLLLYRYCHERQLTVAEDGEELPDVVDKLEWTTVSHGDGDEGPTKDYAWENTPDPPPKK